MFSLVIFDYSGVLVNDLRVSWQAISRIVEYYGKEPDNLEQFRRTIKHPYVEYFTGKGLTEEQASGIKIVELYIDYYERHIDEVEVFPDVIETLSELSKMKLKLAILSQVPRKLIYEVLGRHGLIDYFDPIFGFGDYKELKPRAGSVNAVLKKLKTSPRNAIYIGDMREDIIASKNAGVLPVAIFRGEEAGYHPRSYLEGENPTLIISNLKELLKVW